MYSVLSVSTFCWITQHTKPSAHMHKGYGSCLVCESVCLCVVRLVTALAASAYVYTAKQQYSQIIIHCSFSNPSLLQKWHGQVHVRMYAPAPEMGGVSIARLLFSDWSQFSYTPRKLHFIWQNNGQVHRGKLSVIRQQ